jgi:hypothetical protein
VIDGVTLTGCPQEMGAMTESPAVRDPGGAARPGPDRPP